MKQIQIFGPCTGPEGYAEVTRGLALALYARGWNVKLDPFRQWGPWRVKLAPKVERALRAMHGAELYPQCEPIPHLHVCLPQQVSPVESHLNINVTMFEADRIPAAWVEAARRIDVIAVPNAFCLDTFTSSGVPASKMWKLPLGHDPETFHPGVAPLPLTVNGRPVSTFTYRFMSVQEVTNRKNFWGLLQLYFRVAEQLGPDKCCLILRVGNYSRHLPLPEQLAARRRQWIEENLISPRAQHNVLLYQPLVPAEQMGAFMRAATHYISTSFAEGWDLNCLNAMACGVPVIAPEHSGYTGYCFRNNACMLPVAVKFPAEQGGVTAGLYAGAHWFGVDLNESVNIVRSYVTSPLAQDRVVAALRTAQVFTWGHTAAVLEEKLRKYGA